MDNNVVILTAMPQEAHLLGALLDGKKPTTLSGVECWAGQIVGVEVYLLITGIGKVASALAAQYACDRYSPDWLIVTGVAGGARADTPQGALIVPSRAVQWDIDARPLVDRPGLVPGRESVYFSADASLVDYASRASASQSKAPLFGGTVLSGDAVIASAQQRDQLRQRYPDATCVDMETAAVAQVAAANGTPWVAIRMVSDSADEGLDGATVLEFATQSAASQLASIAEELIVLATGAGFPTGSTKHIG
jgi:adenosylhomocysteine nucleosidase